MKPTQTQSKEQVDEALERDPFDLEWRRLRKRGEPDGAGGSEPLGSAGGAGGWGSDMAEEAGASVAPAGGVGGAGDAGGAPTEAPAQGPGVSGPLVEPLGGACADAQRWPFWSRYLERFAQDDGRIVDRTDGDKSTSEGQAYGLFFALVANDRPRFEKILEWAEQNLAKGDLAKELPAWKWGRSESGEWKVLDPNAASDADLWMAYALLEASRVWEAPSYDVLARKILANVLAREVLTLPRLGTVVLPGPVGFVLQEGQTHRLNPSYLPPQMFRRFGSLNVPGPWEAIVESTARILREGSPTGRVADWLIFDQKRGFGVDPVTGPIGSYDAIRTYLWVTMLSPEDPLRASLAKATNGLFAHWRRYDFVPEKMDVRTDGPGSRGAPPGFLAVLIAEVSRRGDLEAARQLEEQLAQTWRDGLYGEPPAYYDQNLLLFARGFVEGRYSFAADGTLELLWEAACATR